MTVNGHLTMVIVRLTCVIIIVRSATRLSFQFALGVQVTSSRRLEKLLLPQWGEVFCFYRYYCIALHKYVQVKLFNTLTLFS